MKLDTNQKLFIRESYKKIIQDFKPYHNFSNCSDYQLSKLFSLYQPYLVKKIRAYFDYFSPTRIENKEIYRKIKRLMYENSFDELISEKTFYALFSETMSKTLSKIPYSKVKFHYIWSFIIHHIDYQSVHISEAIEYSIMEEIVNTFKSEFADSSIHSYRNR